MQDAWVRYSAAVYLGLLLAGTLLGGPRGAGMALDRSVHAQPWPRHLMRVTPPSCITTTVPRMREGGA